MAMTIGSAELKGAIGLFCRRRQPVALVVDEMKIVEQGGRSWVGKEGARREPVSATMPD